MENKITTKASIKKSHFIASTIPTNSYPLDIVEYIVEVPSSELKRWNADTIHELEYHFFNIPNNKFYQKISIYANTIEIDAGDNVKGVEGVGPKRALDLVKEYGSAFDIAAAIPAT